MYMSHAHVLQVGTDEDRLAEEYLMDECEESELPPPPAASSLGAGLLGPTPRQSAVGPQASE